MARRGRIWRSARPRPASATWKIRSGALAAHPRPPGGAPDPGRPDPAAACPHDSGAGRDPARGSRRLCRRADRAGAGAVQHQRADRIPARYAVLVSRHAPACQHRSGRAAVRRDRRSDRRRRRRYRHHRRHRRCRTADDLSVPLATASCWWWRAIIRSRSNPRSDSPTCSITILSGSIAPAPCSAFSPTRRAASAGRCGCACSCAASTRSAAWSKRNVGVGIVPETTAQRAAKSIGDQGGRTGRCLGAARSHHLRARLRRAAALRAAARQSHARRADERRALRH